MNIVFAAETTSIDVFVSLVSTLGFPIVIVCALGFGFWRFAVALWEWGIAGRMVNGQFQPGKLSLLVDANIKFLEEATTAMKMIQEDLAELSDRQAEMDSKIDKILQGHNKG